MMLHNIAEEVNKNCTISSKKIANFCKPFVLTPDFPAENTISSSFSANTEDISLVKIQSFEANFLGKGEVFSANFDFFGSLYDFNSTHSSQFNQSSGNEAASNKFKFSNQSVHSNSFPSVLRCLADSKVNENNNDLASSIFNTAPNSLNLPDEPLAEEPEGKMPLSSFALNYQNYFDSANQEVNCPSRSRPLLSCENLSNASLTWGGSLNSEASSDHLLKMINCLIEEAEVQKLAQAAKDEEIKLLRKEVDHLKQTTHAILMYLDALPKSLEKSRQPSRIEAKNNPWKYVNHKPKLKSIEQSK